MGENNDPMNSMNVDAPGEKGLKLISGLVELFTRATPKSVSNRLIGLDEIAVAIVLVAPPVIAVAMNDSINKLNFDGKDPARSKKDLIDFAFRVPIARNQYPVVRQC